MSKVCLKFIEVHCCVVARVQRFIVKCKCRRNGIQTMGNGPPRQFPTSECFHTRTLRLVFKLVTHVESCNGFMTLIVSRLWKLICRSNWFILGRDGAIVVILNMEINLKLTSDCPLNFNHLFTTLTHL